MPNLIECLRDIKCNSPCLSTCIPTIVNTLTENSQDVSSGPESRNTMLKVRGKASDVKMFSQAIMNKMNKRFKDLTKLIIGTWLITILYQSKYGITPPPPKTSPPKVLRAYISPGLIFGGLRYIKNELVLNSNTIEFELKFENINAMVSLGRNFNAKVV